MAAALCRKRPSPLVQGTQKAWGCGIVCTLGRVNFLFDTSQAPQVSARELCSYFEVGESTASEKDKRIQDSLKIYVFDPRWTLGSRLADNQRLWQIMFNGLVVDDREAPREIQEEAVRRGLPEDTATSANAVLFCPGPDRRGRTTKSVHEFFDLTGYLTLAFCFDFQKRRCVMRKIGLAAILIVLSVGSAYTATKEEERLANAAKAFDEIMSAPDKGIPGSVLDKADCIVIIPGMKKEDLLLAAAMGRAW